MRLLLPFERGRPLLQLSSDASTPAVDSDLSQPKKRKSKSNESEYNQSIAFDDSLTASSTQASISCSRHRRLPAPVHERWMKVSLTTNSRMLGTISFRGITPVERPSSSLFLNLVERQKRSPERPRLFQGKEGDRMRDGVPAEWKGHPWGQLCKTQSTKKWDGKTTKKITRNPAQSEWRENPCALEGSEAVRTLIDK